MEQLSQIRKRIQSISEIRKITKAMGLISAVHLRDSREKEYISHPFITHCALTIADLVQTSPELIDQVLHYQDFEKQKRYPIRIYILTGDRGLSGDYNESILQLTENLITQRTEEIHAEGFEKKPEFELFFAGQIGRSRLKNQGYQVNEDFTFSIEDPNYYKSMDLADQVMDCAMNNEAAEIYFVYCRLDNAITTEPIYTKVFPLDASSMIWLSKTRTEREHERREQIKQDLAKRSGIRMNEATYTAVREAEELEVEKAKTNKLLPFAFEGDKHTVISYLIGTYANALVYGMLTEAYASELLSRMTSMEGATRNADDLMQKLTRQRNRYRQMQITTELTEIVSSAEAITKQ